MEGLPHEVVIQVSKHLSFRDAEKFGQCLDRFSSIHSQVSSLKHGNFDGFDPLHNDEHHLLGLQCPNQYSKFISIRSIGPSDLLTAVSKGRLAFVEHAVKQYIEISDYVKAIHNATLENQREVLELLKSPHQMFTAQYIFSSAVRYNLIEVVQQYISDERVDPNKELIEACEKGHFEIVKLLLADHRYVPSCINNYLAILQASAKGHFEILKLLLAEKRVDLSSSDLNMAIIKASGNGHFDLVKLLLADKRVSPSSSDLDKAIIEASGKGHFEIVKQLLLAGKRLSPSTDLGIVISEASEFGHFEIVKLLLSDKRVNLSSSDINNAISEAFKNDHSKVVEVLLADKRVDPSRLSRELIRWASTNGHAKIVKLLLKDSFSSWVDPSVNHNFPIRMAIQNGHVDVIKLLLKRIGIDEKNFAFQYACDRGRGKAEIIKLFLKDRKVYFGSFCQEAFITACSVNNIDLVRLFLKDKRINPGIDGNAAIQEASRNGHSEIVKLLLKDKRVNPGAERNAAICLASQNGNVKIVEMLVKDKRVDATDNDYCAFRTASNDLVLDVLFKNSRGRLDILRLCGSQYLEGFIERKGKQLLEERNHLMKGCRWLNSAIRGGGEAENLLY